MKKVKLVDLILHCGGYSGAARYLARRGVEVSSMTVKRWAEGTHPIPALCKMLTDIGVEVA